MIVNAFLTGTCSRPQLLSVFECASSKVDHSKCCDRAGIQKFMGGRCMPFCRAHQTLQMRNPLYFMPCLQVFEPIKKCYRDYQSTNTKSKQNM
ncbi:hypothetical protein KIN20_002071 [Parelaphostrongylus tenuis]|uniref:Domain of unknown function DB domain-containing protein n=1 Tax=Parelaphostrongylus tenuis TaxID=148309 RepID=A0AAD5QGJ3_PARTN|nr:hypothetical protein KIN20_002071 [Parelaphostrongylus tenuis]